MRLCDLLDESVIKVGLESLDKEECFAEIVDLLARAGRLSDPDGVLKAINDREAQGTTGIGRGVGVPHAKHPSIATLTIAVGIAPQGVEFDPVDGIPVRLVILLVARMDEPGPHVQALAEIGRLAHLPGFFQKMVKASTPREVLDILEAEE